MFWLTVFLFPMYSVISCQLGNQWISHIAILVYMGLNMIFDFVFASQYMEKESIKYQLKYD